MKKICFGAIALTMTLMLCACGGAPAPVSSSEAATPVSSQETASVPESAPDAPVSSKEAADTEPLTVSVASLKGPTSMGLAKFINDAKTPAGNVTYNIELFGSPDEFSARLVKGELDMALIPANLASVLFNKTEGKLSVAAINTLGVLYIVENGDTVQSVKDLQGKTIYSTGKGTTPEFVLNYILSENGLTAGKDVTVEFKAEAAEVAAAMQSNPAGSIALLPQPYVTTLTMQNKSLRTALNLSEEWTKVSPDSALVTGVLVAQKAFIEQQPQVFEEFLRDYKASTEFANTNVDEAAGLIADAGIVPKPEIAKAALPHCSITFIQGDEMKSKLSGYLQVLLEQNPQAVGGKLPSEDFYYGG